MVDLFTVMREATSELLKLGCSDSWTTDTPHTIFFSKEVFGELESAFVVGICQGAMAFCSDDGLRHPYNLMTGLKLKHAHRRAYTITHTHVYTHIRPH